MCIEALNTLSLFLVRSVEISSVTNTLVSDAPDSAFH
jgi:hypothetical protein